jgi:Flp pilus assembly protein TadB
MEMAYESDDRIWQQLCEASRFERHFNQLQAGYRGLASTWLLATFGGIGFAIANGDKMIAVPYLYAASGVAVLGAIGVFLIWIVDMLVYNQMSDAIFFTARALERQHPELAPFRVRMFELTGTEGVAWHVCWFYIVGTGVLLAIGAIAAALELVKLGGVWWVLALAAGGAAVVVTTIRIRRRTGECQRSVRTVFPDLAQAGADQLRSLETRTT